MNDNNHDAAEAALGLLGLSPTNTFPPSLIPLKRKKSPVIAHNSDDISCICGFTYDDGFSIACDDCSRWCHAACFDILEGEVPEEFRCWECVPRAVDKERAVKIQRERIRQVQEQAELDRVKRRASPGVERKQRRASTASTPTATFAVPHIVDHSKRKRRPSLHDELDIEEPWSLSYVHIPRDIIPHEDTREKLRRQAQHWRGITALVDDTASSSRTTVRPLQPSSFSNPALSLCTNPSVRPPSYSVHTATTIPSDHLIAPFTSTITPSSSYLSDPLNSYAHLGMPKPFVHLIGHPLGLALDSRITGNSARFVRNGCRPNAVLRPFLCPQPKQPPETLSFGVFALRDLKADEEVVLGWEWDDGHVVHHLPALIESPMALPCAFPNDHLSPEKLHHIRNQMSNILHALSSTFTSCACGASAKHCAITQMAAFVDGEPLQSPGKRVDLGPLVGARRGFKTRERVPFSGGLSGVEMYDENGVDDGGSVRAPVPDIVLSPTEEENAPPQNGPLSFHTIAEYVSNDSQVPLRKRNMHLSPTYPHADANTHVDQATCEDKMPPKMRKKWIHRESEVLRESSNRHSESDASHCIGNANGVGLGIRLDVGDSQAMPPPLLPSSRSPQVFQAPQVSLGTSPSASFARLSLVSPIMPDTPETPVSFPSSNPHPSQLPHSTVREIETDLVTYCSAPPPPPSHSVLPAGEEQETLSKLPPPSETSAGDVLASRPTTSPPPLPSLPVATSSSSPPTEDAKKEVPESEAAVPNERILCDIPPNSNIPPLTSSMETSQTTPKVKMSLKDFAIRKRKQREEEQTKICAAVPSGLMEAEEPEESADGPVSCDEAKGSGDEPNAEEDVKNEGRLEVEDVSMDDGTLGELPQPPRTSPPPSSMFTLADSRQAKQELVDPSLLPAFDAPERMAEDVRKSSSSLQRQPSQEDGEIPNTSVESPKPSKRVAVDPQPLQHPITFIPRSHTPPTQPRSFNSSPYTLSPSPSTPSNSPITSRSTSRRPSVTSYRPPVPTGIQSAIPAGATSSGTSAASRPLPSGPRALRSANPMPYRSYSNSHYVPRGPSADRDRLDWERERAWQRTRVRGPGWR